MTELCHSGGEEEKCLWADDETDKPYLGLQVTLLLSDRRGGEGPGPQAQQSDQRTPRGVVVRQKQSYLETQIQTHTQITRYVCQRNLYHYPDPCLYRLVATVDTYELLSPTVTLSRGIALRSYAVNSPVCLLKAECSSLRTWLPIRSTMALSHTLQKTLLQPFVPL